MMEQSKKKVNNIYGKTWMFSTVEKKVICIWPKYIDARHVTPMTIKYAWTRCSRTSRETMAD